LPQTLFLIRSLSSSCNPKPRMQLVCYPGSQMFELILHSSRTENGNPHTMQVDGPRGFFRAVSCSVDNRMCAPICGAKFPPIIICPGYPQSVFSQLRKRGRSDSAAGCVAQYRLSILIAKLRSRREVARTSRNSCFQLDIISLPPHVYESVEYLMKGACLGPHASRFHSCTGKYCQHSCFRSDG
jgi:hypothetical protein